MVDEDSVKATDMFNHELRDRVKRNTRKNMAFLDENDDMFETLFKYYETLKFQMKNIKHLERRMENHDDDIVLLEKVLLTPT